jgi:hypothetical protein
MCLTLLWVVSSLMRLIGLPRLLRVRRGARHVNRGAGRRRDDPGARDALGIVREFRLNGLL